MTHEERKQIWLERITSYKRSGLSKKAWSKSNGVSRGSLTHWLNELSENNTINTKRAKGFIQAKITPTITTEAQEKDSVLSIHVGYTTIDVRNGFNKDTLLSVLQVVKD